MVKHGFLNTFTINLFLSQKLFIYFSVKFFVDPPHICWSQYVTSGNLFICENVSCAEEVIHCTLPAAVVCMKGIEAEYI